MTCDKCGKIRPLGKDWSYCPKCGGDFKEELRVPTEHEKFLIKEVEEYAEDAYQKIRQVCLKGFMNYLQENEEIQP